MAVPPVRVAKNPDVPAATTPPTTISTIEEVLDHAVKHYLLKML